MSRPIKVSVVIPCFNHGEFLPEAVASVKCMNRPDVELIVVDDGSSDDQTLREVGDLEIAGFRVIRQRNSGLAAARNAGISASAGDYILPLDADNRVRAGYIEHGIRILDANPRTGVVYGDAEYFGTRTGRWRVGAFEDTRLLHWNYIDACAVYRRAVWEQNGGYDGTMPIQGLEDWDFWLGALKRGWQFVYVPEILFDYRVGSESMITRTRGFEKQIEEFIGQKHGALYRAAWLEVTRERQSVKRTGSRLRALLKVRIRARLKRNGEIPWVP